jgi:hypothetical protein
MLNTDNRQCTQQHVYCVCNNYIMYAIVVTY